MVDIITKNAENKELFFSSFHWTAGSIGMKSATMRQRYSISVVKGCHVLFSQARAQNTANIGEGNDTHSYTHTRQGCEGRLYQTLEVGITKARGDVYLCLCSAHERAS